MEKGILDFKISRIQHPPPTTTTTSTTKNEIFTNIQALSGTDHSELIIHKNNKYCDHVGHCMVLHFVVAWGCMKRHVVLLDNMCSVMHFVINFAVPHLAAFYDTFVKSSKRVWLVWKKAFKIFKYL